MAAILQSALKLLALILSLFIIYKDGGGGGGEVLRRFNCFLGNVSMRGGVAFFGGGVRG